MTAFKAPATSPYPEPEQSSPWLPIPLQEAQFNIILLFVCYTYPYLNLQLHKTTQTNCTTLYTANFVVVGHVIILQFMPRSSKWSHSIRSPHQNPVNTSPVSYMCHVSRPSHSSWFDHPNNIWWVVQNIKLLVMWSSPLFCYVVPLRPKIFLSTLSRKPPTYISPWMWETKLHTHGGGGGTIYFDLHIFG